MEEFDLLGHLHDGESSNNLPNQEGEFIQVLLWKKLDINGYVPASREGHTSVSLNRCVYIFGGVEGSKRVNTTMRLDLQSQSWSLFKAMGSFPPPRTSHASTIFGSYMVIQGGEGFKEYSIDIAPEEPLLDFPSSTLDGKFGMAGTLQAPSKATPGQLAGVCPGDTLQGLKMGPSVKVQKVPSQVTLTPEQAQTTQQVMSCFDDLYVLGLHNARWYDIKTNLAPLPRKGHSINVVNLSNSGDASKNCLLVFGGFSPDNLTVSNSILACSIEHIVKYIERSDRILSDGKNISDYELLAGQQKAKRAFNADYDLQPVVWRTLPAKGATPMGRFRHSSTVVKDNSGADLLVVIGGIGADQSHPLNDVHILQCDTLMWMKLDSHTDGPGKGISLDGPFNGIYGHASFPFSSHAYMMSLLDNAENQGDECKEIIVFGGSYDTSSPKASCYPYLFGYNYVKDTWRRIPMSHQYPMSRTGHSHAVVNGWTPTFDTPFIQTKSSANLTTLDTTNANNDFTRNSVIIFGGVTSAKMVNDTWALDLLYRTAGLDQYDNNTNQIIQTTMQGFHPMGFSTEEIGSDLHLMNAHTGISQLHLREDENEVILHGANQFAEMSSLRRVGSAQSNVNMHGTKTIHSVNDQKYLNWKKTPSQTNFHDTAAGGNTTKLRPPTMLSRDAAVSQSVPSLHAFQMSNTSTTNHNQNNRMSMMSEYNLQQTHPSPMFENGDESDTIMKFKRERAITEIQLSQERNRCMQLEAQVKSLGAANNDLLSQLSESTEKYESEISTLKRLLEESLRRESELKVLNDEASELLIVYGLSRLQHR